jgi:type I restriction enzyme M protein
MNNDSNNLVSKVWNYAHILRDQGISYGDYVEQITFLLFLKMDQERSDLLNEASIIPAKWRWDKLAPLAGDELELQYRHTLENLAKEKGLIGTIFRKAQNKLTDPAKLKRIVSLIDDETWIGIGVDVKGAIYEGLLEKNAAEVKSGAGQYFTPRPLIEGMVKVMDLRIGETVHDPACGTGGFLLAAYDHMKGQSQDRVKQRNLREKSLSGVDIVDEVVRLCGMNLFLHGIGNGESPIRSGDALASDPGDRYDVVLTNPPFGRKSSYRVIGEDGEVNTEREDYERDDFKFTTSNKQINFLQHIMTIMESDGRAAVVLPDNVLFEAGSAGEGIRKRLLMQFDFHTLMRLPTGIFYRPGVKANVLFFDKHAPRSDGRANSNALWIYDFRTNMHLTLRKNSLKPADLNDFVKCYSHEDRNKREETERFKRFAVDDLLKRDKLNLDIFWLKDESLDDVDSLPSPDVIAAEIVENLQAALEQFQSVVLDLAPLAAGDGENAKRGLSEGCFRH